MTIVYKKADLGPKNDAERLIFAQEGLRVDFQVALHELMLELGVTESELNAKLQRAGVPGYELRYADIMDDYSNLTLQQIATVLQVLGKQLKITFVPEEK